MLQFRLLLFTYIALQLHDLTASATFPLPMSQQQAMHVNNNTPAHSSITAPISHQTLIDSADMAMLFGSDKSQKSHLAYLAANSQQTDSLDNVSAHVHDDIEESRQRTFAYELSFKKNNQRAAQKIQLQEDRAQIRAEKEIVQKFLDIKEKTFKQIETSSTQPTQWGDYFPITKPVFAYLGWRESESIFAERIKCRITQKAHTVACSEMQSVIAQAIAYAGYDKAEQTIRFFINNGMHCDPSSEKKETDEIDHNKLCKNRIDTNKNQHHGNTNKSHKNNDDLNDPDYHGDIIIKGKLYWQEPIIDSNSQCIVGNIKIPYDNATGGNIELYYKNPIPIGNNKHTEFNKFAPQHAHFKNHAQHIDHMNRINKAQSLVTKLNHTNSHTQETINNQLQKQGFNCSDTSSIETRSQGTTQFISFNEGSYRMTIGIQPDNVTYVASKVELPPTLPMHHAPYPLPSNTPVVPAHNQSITTSKTQVPSTNIQQIPVTNLPTNTTVNSQTDSNQPTQATHITNHIHQKSDPHAPKNLSPAQAVVANIIYNQSSQHTQQYDHHEKFAQQKKSKYSSRANEERRTMLEEQDRWMQKHTNPKDMTSKENGMVQDMLASIMYAENDTELEIAQSGLRAWQQAQDATCDDEQKYHLKRCHDLYHTIEYRMPKLPIANPALEISYYELNNLLDDYSTALTMYKNEMPDKHQPLNNAHYFDRLEKRAQALAESKLQINTNKTINHSYQLSLQARDFLLTNNMNHAAFNGGNVINFQHCLTQEIVKVIESSADLAQKHDEKSTIGQIAYHNCNLAISAQQLNQIGNIEQAVAVVDMAHLFDEYAQFLHKSQYINPLSIEIHVGIMQGTAQALYSWGNFLKDLTGKPRQTLGKMAHDYQKIGNVLYTIAGHVCEFMPHAYLHDMMEDMQDRLSSIKNSTNSQDQNSDNLDDSSRMMQRTMRNAQLLQDGLYGAVETAQAIIEKMMHNSVRQNVAISTEIIIDNMITAKATDCLCKLSQIVGNQVLQVADTINTAIPPHLLDSKPIFMQATTGELIAIADTTGESIGAVVAAKIAVDNAETIIKNAARSKALFDKIQEITPTEKEKIEKFQKSIDPYLNSEKIINLERLKEIAYDIPQVEEFKKYTNNFQNLEKLKPEEVLYLNLCDWLEPQTKKINDALHKRGGIKFCDIESKTEIIIEKFDLIHSLLGEMKPEALANRTSGGHLFITELRAATLDIGDIKQFGNGFFDMEIKYAGKISNAYKNNSYFPLGTTAEQSVNIIEDAILNSKNIMPKKAKDSTLQGFIFTNQQEQDFAILIKNKTIQFFPIKSE